MSDLSLPTLSNFISFVEQKFPDAYKFIDLMKQCNAIHNRKYLDIENAFTYLDHMKRFHKWTNKNYKKDLELLDKLIHSYFNNEINDLVKIEEYKREAWFTIGLMETELKNKIPEVIPDSLQYAEIRDKILHEHDKYAQYVIIKDYFMETYVVYTHPTTMDIWIYKEEEGIFKNNGEIFFKQEIQKIMPTWTRDARNEILDKIRNDTYFEDKTPFNQQNIIVFENGVINFNELLEKKDFFHPFSHTFLATKKIPVIYNKDLILLDSKIDSFLHWATCQDIEFENYLLEAIADCFNNHYKSQIIHLFIGEGQNGKGTFLRLLTDFLGGPLSGNVTALGFGQIYENSFKLHALEYAMANLNGDSSATYVRDPGTLKKASGEDIINADVKNEKRQKPFYNTAKMFSSSQHVPEAKDEDTEGWYRRFKISDWKASLTDQMKANSKSFENDLRTEQEFTHLLNRVLQAFINLAENNYVFKFASRTPEEKRQDYLKKASPIKLFSENLLSFQNSNGKLYKDVLLAAFNVYNEQILGNRKMDKITFFKKIKYEFEEIPTRQEKGRRYFDGVEINRILWEELLMKYHLEKYIPIIDSEMVDISNVANGNFEGYPFIDSVVIEIIKKYQADDLCYLDIKNKCFYFKNDIVRDSLDRLLGNGEIYEPRPNIFKIGSNNN